ncbi:hypothetical protein PPL_07492 [Heterostelium album PN500]|uniref:B box-type domain-containing protein n=1 Tax=Heterostelium pallidum (strain ATCC 26659 / Pp 5 / PN500) TaxID=670386 RepID=D3BG41_HETP5|nr:hypothetical protein PPL_07492 [Heterostelium album PN500]EFA79633.1 hypothetical protein PPL_07492 [Heterostelium album PN500]|eukprot:XP_020431754.1 hypothetical protein PPL_07492 [Heterostelium album PN500]
MDSKVNINDFKCSDHKRVLELICHECNKLLCSRCSANHNKDVEHSNYLEHIDDIRLELNQVLKEINNSNNNDNGDNNNEMSACTDVPTKDSFDSTYKPKK